VKGSILALGVLSTLVLADRAAAAEVKVPDAAVALRIRQREAWQRTIAASRAATPEQKGEALGEIA